MVEIPRVPRRLALSEAPKSSLTSADIKAPYTMLSNALNEAGEALSDIAVPLAEEAGHKAVSLDEDGNIQVARAPIVGKAGVAFSRAVKVASLAQADARADRDLVELGKQFPNDPDGFLTAATEYRDRRKAQAQTVDAAVGTALARSIDSTTTQVWRGLLNKEQARITHDSHDKISVGLADARNKATALVNGGDYDSDELKTEIRKFHSLTREMSNNPIFNYTKERADYDTAQFNAGLQVARVGYELAGPNGAYDTDGYDGALRKAERIRTDPSINLTPAQRESAYHRVVGQINERARFDNYESRKFTEEFMSIDKLAADGFVPPPNRMAALRSEVDKSDNPALKQRFARAESSVEFAKSARQMSPDELKRTLISLERNPVTATSPELLAQKTIGEHLLKTMRKGLDESPLEWAGRVGLIQVQPIDFASPAASDQMGLRAIQAEQVAAYYGIKPQYLLPDEQATLTAATAQGGAPMLQVAKTMAAGFGERAPAVMAEVAQQAPILAHVGAVLAGEGSQTFARDVAEAVKLRTDKDFKMPRWLDHPSDQILKAQNARTREVFGDAFVLAPDSARAAEASGMAAYFARAHRSGYSALLEDRASKAAYDKAMQESAGAKFSADGTQYGGVGSYSTGLWSSNTKVMVPANVRADRFRDVVTAIRDDDLKTLRVPPQATGERPYTARDLSNTKPVATRGGYRFAVGDPSSENPKWIRGADGQPFVLDFDQLEPVLRQRVPGAFIGGR